MWRVGAASRGRPFAAPAAPPTHATNRCGERDLPVLKAPLIGERWDLA